MSGSSGRSVKKHSAKNVAMMGLLFALAMVFSFIEGMLPSISLGVKLGLSNIVTMYCLFFLGKKSAFTLTLLKSGFVFLTRSPTGALMSLCGGICAILIMMFLLSVKKQQLSYLIISIAGAIAHNIGQLVAASFLLGSSTVFYYTPIMVISGVVMGSATGVTLRMILPYMNKLHL